MPRKPVQKIEAWSSSRFSLYKQCPYKLKLTAIDKLREPASDAMARGNEIHKLAENFVQGKLRRLPGELALFDDEFWALREAYGLGDVEVEGSWAFDMSWHPTEYFAHDAWLRVKVDAAEMLRDRVLKIIDYKTGKIRDGYEEQLELYAAAAFSMYDDLEEAHTELWYLDQGEIRGGRDGAGVYTASEADELRELWNKRTRKMLADTRFDPTPNRYCGYCHFRKDNNGPCKF